MSTLNLNESHPRLDRVQTMAVAGLMLVGAFFVYSATMANESAAIAPWYNQSWVRQIFWYGVGGGAAIAMCIIDYRSIARWALVAYVISILLLVAVLIPGIGSTHGWGARRWFDLGLLSLQPSEFAKLAVILALANYLSQPSEELRSPGPLLKSLGFIVLPFLLIMKEPDLGSALVLLPTGLAMMFVAGVPRRYLLWLMAVGGILGALLLVDVLFAPPNWRIKLEDYQRKRLMVYLGIPFAVPEGATTAERARLREQWRNSIYNVEQAAISVGSGGLTGKGWRQGTQNSLGYLPRAVAHNDFIFSVIAEEKGFVGSVTVLTLYGLVLFSGIRIAGQARDRLGRLLAAGIVALLFSHIFINIGMNIRIMPVTGVPLPLLSYGGSSVLGSLLALGLLQNVHLHRRTY